MSNETAEQQEQTTGAADKPGNLLRNARIEQELGIEDITKRIHLEGKIIEAIEADDFSKISTSTYARGYLRSYAKAVGLDGDYIVSLYNSDNESPPPEILPEVKPPSQVSSSDKPVKAFTYLISLALVLLLLIWYQSNFVIDNDDPEPGAETTTTDQTDTTEINNTDTSFDVVIHPEGWQSPAPVNPEPLASEQQEPGTAVPTFIDPAIDMNLSTSDASSEMEPGIEQEQPLATGTETDTVVETIIAGGTDKIDLVVSKDSWIEIYDANDERLFMDLGKQGEQFQVQGTAPFNLILGYSPGVSIKFNNEQFDTEPYSENGVARFQLPPE